MCSMMCCLIFFFNDQVPCLPLFAALVLELLFLQGCSEKLIENLFM